MLKQPYCLFVIEIIVFITIFSYKNPVILDQFFNAAIMKKHIQPLLFLVLVVASLPALQGYPRILQVISSESSPHYATAPGSSSAPTLPPPQTPAPSPYTTIAPGSSPARTPTPPPSLVPAQSPPLPTGGGGCGNVVPHDNSGDGSSGLSGGQMAGIVIGVLAGAGVIWFATMVYPKRRSNIQRARYVVLARRSEL